MPTVLDQALVNVEAAADQCQLTKQEVILGQTRHLYPALDRHGADKIHTVPGPKTPDCIEPHGHRGMRDRRTEKRTDKDAVLARGHIENTYLAAGSINH